MFPGLLIFQCRIAVLLVPARIPALVFCVEVELLLVHEARNRLDCLAGFVVGSAGYHGCPVVEVICENYRRNRQAHDDS